MPELALGILLVNLALVLIAVALWFISDRRTFFKLVLVELVLTGSTTYLWSASY